MIKSQIHIPEEESGKEKHVPDIEIIDEKTVKVACGKDIMHPSTEAHYIAWIKLFGKSKDGMFRELGSANLTPVLSIPATTFSIETENFSELYSLIYCNIHGLWQNSLKL